MMTDGLHKKIFIYSDYLNNTIKEPNTIIAIIAHTAVPKLCRNPPASLSYILSPKSKINPRIQNKVSTSILSF